MLGHGYSQREPFCSLPLSDDLYRRALDLYRSRPDKEWGLTDCASFTVMSDRGLADALTADEHSRQAGLRALLLEDHDL